MKKLYKALLTLMIAISAFTMNVSAASFTANPSTQTVNPGGTFTVAIGGDCIGRVDISVDNGTITSISSEGKVLSSTTAKTWVEENKYTTVTIKAGESGTVTITAAPFEGVLSTPDSKPYEPGNRVVKVNIVQPEPEKISIKNANVSNIADQKYTGSEIKPSFTVTLSGKTLVAGTDYTASYKNNVNAGTATITITGIGEYKDTITKTFKIVKENTGPTTPSNPDNNQPSKPENKKPSVENATVTYEDNITYTGNEIKPNVKVVLDGKELKEGVDYTVTYSNNKEVGKGTITIKGIGEYEGSLNKSFTITKPKLSLNDASVTEIYDVAYTGNEIKPSFIVSYNGNILTEGVDYKVAYKDNVEVGTATVTITGIGQYEGELNKSFDIVKPVQDGKGCTTHYVLIIVCLAAALMMFIINKTTTVNLIIAGIAGVATIAIASISSSCPLDLPVAVTGIALLVALGFKKK